MLAAEGLLDPSMMAAHCVHADAEEIDLLARHGVDLVTLMKRPLVAEEVNEVVKSAAATKYRNIVEFTDQPVVSSDVIGNPHSAVFDGLSTSVLGGNLLKTLTWYDNGWGYATRVVELIGRLSAFETGAAPKGR